MRTVLKLVLKKFLQLCKVKWTDGRVEVTPRRDVEAQAY